MRINGFPSTTYSLDRAVRPGSEVTPYREMVGSGTATREANPASQPSRVAPPGSARPGSLAELTTPYRPALNSYAAQALASYASTASLAADPDALEVLGLDLYA